MITRVTCKWSILNFSILMSIRYDWWQKCFIFPLEIVYFKGNLLLDDRIIFILVVTFKNFLWLSFLFYHNWEDVISEKYLQKSKNNGSVVLNSVNVPFLRAVFMWEWSCLSTPGRTETRAGSVDRSSLARASSRSGRLRAKLGAVATTAKIRLLNVLLVR